MAKSNVPSDDNPFNNYINSSTAHLLSLRAGSNVYVLLGITGPEMTDWETQKNNWNINWAKYVDLNQRTRTVTETKNNMKKDFIEFAGPLLTRVSVSPALTEADREALNIPERDSTITRRGKINDAPDVNMIPIAGGIMKIRTRTSSDASRASMHPLADGVEMKYQIGGTAPTSASQCPNSFVSAKALFEFECGQENAGKRLYIFCRYVNLSNHENDGPWTTMHNAIIEG